LVLFGLLSFPAYSVYWVWHHARGEGRRQISVGVLGFLAWCVATYFCFIGPMLGCLGGGCADRVSPFLELAIVYALTSGALIVLMHRWRTRRSATKC
jgi:hypothetical protein